VVVPERVEHHFNRRYGVNRRDVYLIRTPTGWQVLGREGGADADAPADRHRPDRVDLRVRRSDPPDRRRGRWDAYGRRTTSASPAPSSTV
jgi:hypothetical protein